MAKIKGLVGSKAGPWRRSPTQSSLLVLLLHYFQGDQESHKLSWKPATIRTILACSQVQRTEQGPAGGIPGAVTSLSPPNQWKQQQPRQRGGNTYTVKRPTPAPAFRSTPSSARGPWASTYRFRPVYCCWTSENFASALFVLLHSEFL